MAAERIHFSQDRPEHCPVCGSARVVDIVYGLPGPELLEFAEAGHVWLGGCCVSEADPDWCCLDCRTLIYPERLRGQITT